VNLLSATEHTRNMNCLMSGGLTVAVDDKYCVYARKYILDMPLVSLSLQLAEIMAPTEHVRIS
jgi:hypothetical protein